MTLGGLVLSLRLDSSYWRLGLHHAEAEMDYGPIYTGYDYVQAAPGIGYYQTLSELPGPGVPTTDKIVINVLTLSTEVELPHRSKLIAEYVRRRLEDTDLGPDVNAG
ncbi:hypothetical protein [Thiorhodococcus minor]|uniref:Uncharacterized protein n=1 Tax=Thiorhodococcus minor TaxID=57489 RepID=A0A6M0K392_9GAMM|nr:hypothetical protein [Thiorhodococcus minor]NEV63859.1 hypothetical protein [Thiorhodococcus minor]